jgi:hypothetical protein
VVAKRRSGPGFFAGLVIGIAIGAAAALLLAQPAEAPGKASAGEGKTAADGGATEDPLAVLAGRVRDRYQDAVIQGREAYERARAEVLQMYNQARIQQ